MNGRRILQVVGRTDRGGTETWLCHVLRRLDRNRFQMDFLVHSTEPGAYDETIRTLGARLIVCPEPNRPWRYARSFRRVLAQAGPYDVVHSHVHHYSGFVLRLARQAGVAGRIAHSHSSRANRTVYGTVARRWIRAHATAGVAVSGQAARALFGESWRKDSRWRLQSCGIDIDRFRHLPDRRVCRAALGLPEGPVVGHVGRFAPVKNQRFFLEIARRIAAQQPDVRFVLVGEGPLRPELERLAASLELQKRTWFAGPQADVATWLGAMDVFVFPSLHEGLGLALVEAQAAGVRCLASDLVPGEADAVPGLVERLPLGTGAECWAERVLRLLEAPAPIREAPLEAVAKGPFSLEKSVSLLEALYA